MASNTFKIIIISIFTFSCVENEKVSNDNMQNKEYYLNEYKRLEKYRNADSLKKLKLILDTIIDKYNGGDNFINNRGLVLMDLGRYNEALVDLNVAIRSDSFRIINRSQVYFALGEKDKGIQDLKIILRLDKDTSGFYLKMGNYYNSVGRYEKAIDYLDSSIIYNSKEVFSYYIRAISKENIGDTSGACKDFYIAKSLGINDNFNIDSNIYKLRCGN